MKKFSAIIQSFLALPFAALSVYLLYHQNQLIIEGKRPYIFFTPKVVASKTVPQGLEFQLVVGNYGEGTAIIDKFSIISAGKTYTSDLGSQWKNILHQHGIAEQCPMSEGWLIKGSVLSSGQEEDKFLSLIYSTNNSQIKQQCIVPFVNMLKEGKIKIKLKYRSIYKDYDDELTIQYDFSPVLPLLI
ncbi:hypothetical protein EDC45_0855 [Mesocricetibacter intestinalis]|uniref:Uncharacterized protein n=1 Tax=Mesocricetibacter intestinalis TaxID=1521930 RepID=A0A4R6VBP9_9PAST|nr:hypothetical protein [Mesocricetibacter intestinalis]TDQ59063.1 hypothetical protein EDC45_0855 [Mesocricetibacter intestinalis]